MDHLALKDDGFVSDIATMRAAMQLMPQDLSAAINEDMFADGVYLRMMHMKRGALVAGATHNTKHFVVILKGALKISDGKRVDIFRAPKLVLYEPGVQRTLYAMQDSSFFTIHPDPTGCQDAEILSETLIKEPYNELCGQPGNIQAMNNSRQIGVKNAGNLEERPEAD